ncbi:MAG: 2-amino-4-hydroxy-6-hydroxymethyldihydropteridine diphosphokinase [Candidatus Acidulodesulfobacterium sp.]
MNLANAKFDGEDFIVCLGLGSNVGNKESNLLKAMDFIKNRANILSVSSIYLTSPVGNENQPFFLNCAVIISIPSKSNNNTDGLSSFFHELLSFLKNIEKIMGRKEYSVRYMPRVIDIDILFAYSVGLKKYILIDSPDLKIPHKEIFNRLFVMLPLLDFANVSSGFIFNKPFDKESIKKALAELKKTDAGASQKISYYAKFYENLRGIAR